MDRLALLAQVRDVALGQVGLGAVRADAEDVGALLERDVEVARIVAKPGMPNACSFTSVSCSRAIRSISRSLSSACADLQRGGAEPVAVADLDDRHAGRVRPPPRSGGSAARSAGA